MKYSFSQKPTSHSVPVKIIHWGFAGLFAYGVMKGLNSVAQLADPAVWRFEMIFAGIFLALIALRFKLTRSHPTSLPEDTIQPMMILAKAAHLGLYIFPASIAITGLGIGALYALGMTTGIVLNGVIALHEFAITASYALVGAHICAAVGHRLLGDGVWSSMVPILRED